MRVPVWFTPHFRYFCMIWFCFMWYGAVYALFGPSLIEFARHTNAQKSLIPLIPATRSIGLAIGAVAGGKLVDKYVAKGRTMLAASMAFISVSTFIIPNVSSLVLLCFIGIIFGVAGGTVDNDAQMLVIRSMKPGQNVGPYIQAIHFGFGCGGVVSPLILDSFFDGSIDTDNYLDSVIYSTQPVYAANGTIISPGVVDNYQYRLPTGFAIAAACMLPTVFFAVLYAYLDEWKSASEPLKENTIIDIRLTNTPMNQLTDGQESDAIELTEERTPKPVVISTNEIDCSKRDETIEEKESDDATMPLAVADDSTISLSTTAPTEADALPSPSSSQPSSEYVSPPSSSSHPSASPDSRRQKYLVVIFCGLFLFFYMGLESTHASYLLTYCTSMLNFSESESSLMVSLFWFTFSLGRLLSIPLSLRFTVITLITADLGLACASLLLLIFFPHTPTALYISVSLYGFALASMYPSIIHFAEQTVSLEGVYLAIATTFSMVGDLVLPLLAGELMGAIGGISMLFLELCCGVVVAGVFAACVHLRKKYFPETMSALREHLKGGREAGEMSVQQFDIQPPKLLNEEDQIETETDAQATDRENKGLLLSSPSQNRVDLDASEEMNDSLP